MDKHVDIIIPIYNAYEDLVACIDSLVRHTDMEQHRMILIDDVSTDVRVKPYLDELEKYSYVVVIRNRKNLGFSANINTGISQSENNDVILLNSDTMVTDRWVEKLLACAYADEAIATATPLSNNATIFSVPMYYEENKIPTGYTLDEYAALVENCSLKIYPTVPVAHGFCMFIKREVIQKTGNFDAETFGRGYGEENDFCHRAEQLGYHHVMCDDTYIYHSGTGSFMSEEKKRYIAEHEQIIKDRYPIQHRNSVIYCMNNPNAEISANVQIQTMLHNDKKNMLYLIHSDFRADAEDHVGGTQLHVKDLCDGLRHTFNIFVAARNHDYLNLTAYIGGEELFFQYYVGEKPVFQVFRDREFAKLYGKLLDSFRIDAVHVHHTSGTTLELYYEAHKRAIPIVTTIHDYYTLCPTIKMINGEGKFCDGCVDAGMCQLCLKKRCGISPSLDYISTWREQQRAALILSSNIITPSKEAQEHILKVYPELRSKMQAIPHGSPSFSSISHIGTENSDKTGLHVAFIGGISTEKGGHCAAQMVQKGSANITWYLFGIFGDPELATITKKNFVKTGAYQREELPELIEKHNIDLVCILPVWGETFCYTLSEAILCGVPVIVTDIGALGSRVRDMDCGWVVPKEASADDVLSVINRIADQGDEYKEKKKNACAAAIKSILDMCREYEALYCEKMSETVSTMQRQKDYAWIVKGYGKAIGDARLTGEDGQMMQKLITTEQQLRDIQSSMAYRVANALANMKIPFRKQMKTVVYRSYTLMKRRR